MPQPDSKRVSRDRYDAVLFDLDGVVTDTASVHATCWKQMFDDSSVRLKLEQFQLPVGDKVVFDRIDALEGLLQRQFLEERQRQNL